MTAVARLAYVRVRVRATQHGHELDRRGDPDRAVHRAGATGWCSASVIGSAVASGIIRLPPIKFVFGVAKDMVVADGRRPDPAGARRSTPVPSDPLGAISGSSSSPTCVIEVVDEILAIPVIAFATRTSVRQRFLAYWDIRLMSIAGSVHRRGLHARRCSSLESHLLLAVPPLVLSLHLWHSNRLKGRAERRGVGAARRRHRRAQRRRPRHRAAPRRHPGRRAVLRRRGRDRDLARRPAAGWSAAATTASATTARPTDAPAGTTASSSRRRWRGTTSSADVGVLRLRFRGAGQALRARAVHAAHLRLGAVHRGPQRLRVRRAGAGRRRARARRRPRRADRPDQPPAPARPRQPSCSSAATPTACSPCC